MKVNCHRCGVEFNKFPALVKLATEHGYNHYCSNECRHLGKRRRIIKHCIICNKEMEVHKCTEHRYSTCSLKCQRKNRSNERNSNWQGGKSNRVYRKKALSRREYKDWRKSVFERDDYTCQFCKKRGGIELHADHIKPWKYFPKLRYEISNGRTLCVTCHRTTFKELSQYKNQESCF